MRLFESLDRTSCGAIGLDVERIVVPSRFLVPIHVTSQLESLTRTHGGTYRTPGGKNWQPVRGDLSINISPDIGYDANLFFEWTTQLIDLNAPSRKLGDVAADGADGMAFEGAVFGSVEVEVVG